MADNEKGQRIMSALKKAVCIEDRAARAQNYQSESYQQNDKLSNLKLQLGEFLFLLQTPLRPYERAACLQALESLLREYVCCKGERL
jgi:hypothetical protein